MRRPRRRSSPSPSARSRRTRSRRCPARPHWARWPARWRGCGGGRPGGGPGTPARGGLAGGVAGVRVESPSGDPASGPAIKLRGATSISGSQNPLIIIDGTISRATLADIASEDIDRIEVIKGAAASSLYRSDAPHGAMPLFPQRARNTTHDEVGAAFVSRRIPVSLSNPYLTQTVNGVTSFIDTTGGVVTVLDPLVDAPILKPARIAVHPYPPYHDFQ